MIRVLFASLLLATTAHAQQLDAVRIVTPNVKQHERAEIALTADPGKANPFDPNSIALDATVTLPSGKFLRVPGFWFQDYKHSLKDPAAVDSARVEVLTPLGKSEWRVRFSSGEVGVHKVVLELKDAAGIRKSAPIDVKVSAGDRRGPIRASSRNPMYLEDSAGKAFFAIGQNLCMAPAKEGTYFFERIFPKLAKNGANYVRLWQEYYPAGDVKRSGAPTEGSNTGFPLETAITGMGKYDLECAWKLDTVSDLCDKHGILWQICFEQVVWWNRKMPHRWTRNPYTKANGGVIETPAEYLTDPVCREFAARRHRYSVARWGWSPNLVAWEMWNEVDNLDGLTSEANESWHKELCSKLKAVDPFKHLVTTSWRDPKMFSLPQIDMVQAHSYWNADFDAAQYSLQDSDHLMRPFRKPFFFGEQGTHGIKDPNDYSFDSEGKVFHDCLWSSSLSGAAGAGMHWYWNQYIERFNLYHHYQPLSKFLADADWPAHQWKAMKPTRPNLPVTLNVYGLAAPDRALVWIQDPLAFRVVKGQVVRGSKQTGASVNIAGLDEGQYGIEFWDTATGKVIGTDTQPVRPLRHFGYGIQLNLPDFDGDIAARVLRKGATWKK